MRKAIGLLAVVLVASACTGVIGSGTAKQEMRQVGTFSRLAVSSGLEVDYTVGEPTLVIVSGDDNIVPCIETVVEGDELKIGTEDHTSLMPREPLRVRVQGPALASLAASGGSQVTVATLEVQDFTLTASGGSEVTLTGQCANLLADASGGSELYLQAFSAQTAHLVASGGSEVKAKVTVSAQVDASGGSDITLAGGASIRKTTSGGSEIHVE
ncbi:MAG: DUF2807 domain-containing protein [Deltaproteobacteria bacterium]|nr:DUF2807 domain-containing protein [Deltaproteobacteria bacterium]